MSKLRKLVSKPPEENGADVQRKDAERQTGPRDSGGLSCLSPAQVYIALII